VKQIPTNIKDKITKTYELVGEIVIIELDSNKISEEEQ